MADCLIDKWLIDWLTDWLSDWLNYCEAHSLTPWLSHSITELLSHSLNQAITHSRLQTKSMKPKMTHKMIKPTHIYQYFQSISKLLFTTLQAECGNRQLPRLLQRPLVAQLCSTPNHPGSTWRVIIHVFIHLLPCRINK